jgi:hypothetical protein
MKDYRNWWQNVTRATEVNDFKECVLMTLEVARNPNTEQSLAAILVATAQVYATLYQTETQFYIANRGSQ